MSKPMLVTLPFVMLLLDFWPLRRISNVKSQISDLFRLLLEKMPFLRPDDCLTASLTGLVQGGARLVKRVAHFLVSRWRTR